jgi:hypothetical protein
MKYQKTITILMAVILLTIVKPVFAAENISEQTAQLSSLTTDNTDNRTYIVRTFLQAYDSPMSEAADSFVLFADKYSLDWKLVLAIAGTESTFGKHIPAGSYNAWGWGVFTGKQYGIGFSSWENGIEEVSRGLKENYIDKGAVTLDQIGDIYAASSAWASHVRFFIDKIETFSPSDPLLFDITI